MCMAQVRITVINSAGMTVSPFGRNDPAIPAKQKGRLLPAGPLIKFFMSTLPSNSR